MLLLALLTLFVSPAEAQTPVILAPVPKLQFFSSTGLPLAFGCVFTYAVNSTTPLATYTNNVGNVQNTNPVILSAGGFAGSGSNGIWLQAGLAYSIKVMSSGGTNCATGSTQYTIDGIGGGVTTLTTVVTYSTTPVFVIQAQNQLFEITLTGNATSQPLTAVGIVPPGLVTWEITQDGSGGHTFAWPANSVGGCTIAAGAGQVTLQHFIWDGTNAIATGPCVIGAGPAIDVGNVFANGNVTANSFVHGIAGVSTAGTLALAAADTIGWRNNAGSGNLLLSKNVSDNLVWPNGLSLGGGTALATTNQSGTGNLCMTTNCQLVTPALNGVTVTGTPSAGQGLIATAANAASWANLLVPSGFTVTTGTPGKIIFPASLGGLMIQWFVGSGDGTGNLTATKNFPTAFPTACDAVQVSYEGDGSGNDHNAWYTVNSCSTTSVTIQKQTTGGTNSNSNALILAIGH